LSIFSCNHAPCTFFLLRKSEFERRAIQEFVSHVFLVGFVELVYI